MCQDVAKMCEERAKMSQERRKLSQDRLQDGPREGQDRAKLGQDAAKMAQDSAKSRNFDGFGLSLSTHKSMKTTFLFFYFYVFQFLFSWFGHFRDQFWAIWSPETEQGGEISMDRPVLSCQGAPGAELWPTGWKIGRKRTSLEWENGA